MPFPERTHAFVTEVGMANGTGNSSRLARCSELSLRGEFSNTPPIIQVFGNLQSHFAPKTFFQLSAASGGFTFFLVVFSLEPRCGINVAVSPITASPQAARVATSATVAPAN
jgi:hypothetical protein